MKFIVQLVGDECDLIKKMFMTKKITTTSKHEALCLL